MIKVDLSKPIELEGGATLGFVQLREPQVGDIEEMAVMQASGKPPYVQDITLVASLSGVKIDIIRKMDPVDFQKVQEALTQFPFFAQTLDSLEHGLLGSPDLPMAD